MDCKDAIMLTNRADDDQLDFPQLCKPDERPFEQG